MNTEDQISRRKFLRSAALGAGSLAFGSVLSACRMSSDASVPAVLVTQGPPPPTDEAHVVTTSEPGHSTETTHTDTGEMTPVKALGMLLEGNRRFAEGKSQYPRQDAARRKETAAGQKPFAAVLTCSDSRLPPEIIFDQGIGDIFVIRTAGNVAGDIALGSIEYAVEHLGVGLVVVMGHQKCGAVTAAVEGGEAAGHIADVVETIAPAVSKARLLKGSLIDNAIDANVIEVVKGLRSSQPVLAKMARQKKFEVVGFRYDLNTGIANFIYY